MVNPDPAIEQIREVRHRISEEHGHDPQKLVDYYIELQKQYQSRCLDDALLPCSGKRGSTN
jgi:hypothetical protein